jgi:hypothetical protein
MFSILKKPTLVRPERFAVAAEGERVVIDMGSTRLTMTYEDALTFSQWVRVRAKEAKRNAGDQSRHWHALAIMGGAPEK